MYNSSLGMLLSRMACAKPFWFAARTEAKKLRYPASSAVRVSLYAVSLSYTCSPKDARGNGFAGKVDGVERLMEGTLIPVSWVAANEDCGKVKRDDVYARFDRA